MPSRRDIIRQSLAAGALLGLPRGLHALLAESSTAARPHLDAAVRAERWIRSSRQPTADGVRWPANPLAPDSVSLDLYNGMGGVIVFYLELFHATGDRAHLREAMAGADYLIARLPTAGAPSAAGSRAPDCGLYSGLGGTAYLLERTGTLSGDAKYRDAVARCLALIAALAQPTGKGVEWSDSTDIISGTAGTVWRCCMHIGTEATRRRSGWPAAPDPD
jgi:hypothetical protein